MKTNVVQFPTRYNITSAVHYLEEGGLDELIYATSTCLEVKQTMIQCDTDVMLAVLIMAQRYQNGEMK